MDVGRGAVRAALRGHRFRVTCVARHAEGLWLGLGSYDKSVTVWHAETAALRTRCAAAGGRAWQQVLCGGAGERERGCGRERQAFPA